MDGIKLAQGRKVQLTVVAVALALTVNAAFAAVLVKASTDGQRMYNAWYGHGSKTMVASTEHKVPAHS